MKKLLVKSSSKLKLKLKLNSYIKIQVNNKFSLHKVTYYYKYREYMSKKICQNVRFERKLFTLRLFVKDG